MTKLLHKERFCKRLLCQMQKKGISTSRELARALIDYELIPINHEEISTPAGKLDAIDRARKKTDKHLSDSMEYESLQFEYALAYTVLFKVDLDYIYGLSDVPNKDLANITEKTGLNENTVAILNGMINKKNSFSKICSEVLNTLLCTTEFYGQILFPIAKVIEEYDKRKHTKQSKQAKRTLKDAEAYSFFGATDKMILSLDEYKEFKSQECAFNFKRILTDIIFQRRIK